MNNDPRKWEQKESLRDSPTDPGLRYDQGDQNLADISICSTLETSASAEAGEATVSTAELFANTGALYLQQFHDLLSFNGTLFPWSASLMLSAVAIRLCSLPLVYYNQIHAGRAALAGKELPRVQAFVRQTPGTLLQKYLTFRRLRSLTLRSAGTSSFSLFRWDLLVHLPIVISASMGVRQVAEGKPPEWSDGGLAWFPDLTASDPTGALPILTTAFWVWNANPRSTRSKGTTSKQAAADPVNEKPKEKGSNETIQRVMSSRGEWFNTLLQVVAVASLTFTMDLPAGMLVLWASNGAVTATQRWVLLNDGLRRRVGLYTAEDIAKTAGPPILQGTKKAVEVIRRELQYVQREVLARFQNRSVDQKLRDDLNRVLERERWRGRISMQLEAVIREDDRDGRKYIAVVRKGTATSELGD